MMIFDNGILIELDDNCGLEEKKVIFNSFDNRDEVLDCITSLWQAQSSHAQIVTSNNSEESGESATDVKVITTEGDDNNKEASPKNDP